MGKIIELTAEEFVKRAKALDVGEYFDFAADAECAGEPQSEEELTEWYGVQKLFLFDNEMVIVSKYGGTACTIFPAETDHLTQGAEEMFRLCFGGSVYTIDREVQKQIPSLSLTPGFCLDVRGYTKCGENILISSSKVHELMSEIEERDTEADITGKFADFENSVNYSPEDLRRMAKEVIRRRDNCDGISERYWSIVDEVIRDFSAKKEQGT